MDLSCKRCGKSWTYGGERKFYATCPDCKTSVKISEDGKRRTMEKKVKTPSKKIVNNVEKRMVEQEKMLGEKLEKFGKFFQ